MKSKGRHKSCTPISHLSITSQIRAGIIRAEGSEYFRKQVPGQTHLIFSFNKVTRLAY